MTGDKFVFSVRKFATASGFFSSDNSDPMKANGWVCTARRSPMKGTEINWAQAYEKRMRRFNLEVILIALSALTAWLFVGWWFFQK
jgi:hypothetical protein